MKLQLALLLSVILLCTFTSGSNAQPTPQFTEENYTIYINETSLPSYPRPPDGFVVFSCNSTNITYTIIVSSPSVNTVPFVVDDMSGALSVTSDLDYEMRTSYEFELECVSTILNATDTARVNVQIVPVNEFRPLVSPSGGVSLFINENIPVGTMIVSTVTAPGAALTTYSVTDGDIGPDNEIFYTSDVETDSRNISRNFIFNSTIGAIILVSELDLDAVGLPFLRLSYTITVCDVSPPLPVCPNVAVSISITASNDNSPMFTADYYNVTYSEATLTNTVLVTAPCSDADFGTGSFRGIEIVQVLPANVPDGTFIINGISGAITLSGTLDYETSSTNEIELRCSDTSNLQDTAFVIIEVEDANDNVPVIITGTDPFERISDATQIGSSVFSFQCSDEDSGENANITYSIPDSGTVVPFTIDPVTGNVYVNDSLLLSSDVFLMNYTLKLQCQDNGAVLLMNSTSLLVQVYKDDSTPPVIDDNSISGGTIQVREDVSIGYVLATVTATDDTSQIVVFSFESESSPGQFEIDSQSGAITVSRSLDREDQDSYSLRVVVTEVRVTPGTPRTVFRDLVISVTDANDNAPQCSEQMYSKTISVGTYSSLMLFSISCSDDDISENAQLRYTVTSSLPAISEGRFILDENSGEITFEGKLTRNMSYTFDVTVSDSGLPSLSTTVSVEIIIMQQFQQEGLPLPLYAIIVIAVVGGLLLISCFLIFCFCCCYICNRRRVIKKQKKLLDEGEVKGTIEPRSLILSQYPMQGPEVQPTEGMEFRLTFDTTSFSDGKPSVSPPTTPSLSSSPFDEFVISTTHDIDVVMATEDTTEKEQPMNLFESSQDDLTIEYTQESVDMVMSKV